MREAKDYLKEYGKPAAWAASGSLAGFAAIDQALQGDTAMLEMIAENGEKIDRVGHHALGIFGSLTTEQLYDKFTDGEEDGFGKYAAMIIGGATAGGLGEAAQYSTTYIPGQLDMKGITDGIRGGLITTAFQKGVDSHNKKPKYQTKDTEQTE